jgi:hypothetical protein
VVVTLCHVQAIFGEEFVNGADWSEPGIGISLEVKKQKPKNEAHRNRCPPGVGGMR